jgi:ABC-type nitrate/sulfonate/bicarbonate transport system substrate-binding protein
MSSVKTVFVVLGLAAFFACHTTANAAQKIRACYSAVAGNMTPLWIAKEKGFFAKYGQDVDLTLIQAGPTAAAAMISGDVPLCMFTGPTVIQSRLSGSDLVILAGITNTFDFTFFGAKDLKSIDQLRGKKVGISRFGSATDFAVRVLLQKHGLKPGQDVALLQVGLTTERVAALEAGSVQATLVNVVFTPTMRKKGFAELAERIDAEYQHLALVSSESYIRQNRDQVRSFARALMEGVKYYRANRRETIEVMSKYLRTGNQEVLNATYDWYLSSIPQKPYPTLNGITFILKDIAASDPRARGVDPKSFVNTSFVQELDESGFFGGR